MAAYLRRMHHISLHVSNVDKIANDFVSKFKFHLFATRLTDRSRQLAFRTGSAVFVVSERGRNHRTAPSLTGEPADTHSRKPPAGCLYDVSPHYPVDTVCNVCFEVEDVQGSFDALRRRGCSFLVPPTTVRDRQGQVTYAVLKSILGNVCHTLLDKTKYDGSFLPGFDLVDEDPSATGDVCPVTHVDHVAMVSPIGTSQQVLNWYEHVLGFQRFFVHSEDDVDGGLVVNQNGKGLRLAAMELLKSSETGIVLPSRRKHQPDCKFVIAESLPNQGRNQLDTFLEEHGAAGIQHIALHTSDILSATRMMADAGVPFYLNPAAYYSQGEKLLEILDAGCDPQKLAQNGILLDTDQGQDLLASQTRRYLLQVFTKPLFEEDTFFMELIERRGASGFGDGNIKALWACVQTYMDAENRKEAPKTPQ
ncbi:4-hydroxyphenylpyruvate dioxygenase-like protein [Entelurus aequoreus]|uniref:4-hydroxyphenylpyruvate dioxygenase-like protein n=1 Tax=Entelurus aequoreus TaxID=161455 RepID=UPI002B1DAF98|nr:4-hydroxyphenylpyruvate dioxygenase-like protein [Entelurus aequoreus]